ncbi:MAG TPA: fibronectin type III domain-containing protein [Candidatus Saccharimonadales bacterium]|nr:fibronectin type III domain-containing protein [Candidatus Saccharimonadales bacterium]
MIVRNLLKRVGVIVVAVTIVASNFAFETPVRALATTDSVDEIHFSYGENAGEVIFNWRGSETAFFYGLDSNYGQQATAYQSAISPWDTTGPFYEVKISGLNDNTEYHYKIGESGLDHAFKTRSTGDFSWVDVGDTVSSHCFSYMPAMHQLITNQQPNVVTHGGDISVLDGCGVEAVNSYYTDQEVWSHFAAFQPAWGNHEYAEAKPEAPAGTPRDSLANYKGRSYITNAQTVPNDTETKTSNPGCGGDQGSVVNTCLGEDWGWFDSGKVRFISYPEPWPGAIEDWKVKADILMQQAQSDANVDFIITYGHRPPYTNSTEGPNLTVCAAIDYLAQKYSPRADNQGGKYILNVGHHAHGLEAYGKVNGLMHVLSAAGGQGFTPTANTTPPSEFRVRRLGILAGNYNAQNGTLGIRFVCGPDFLWIKDVCEYGSTIWSMQFTKSTAPVPTPTEWVSNVGVETNLTGWTGKYGSSNYVNIDRSTEQAHSGSASVKVSASTGANNLSSGFNDSPKIIASTTANIGYTQSVWIKPGYVGQKITLRLREWRPNWAMAGEVSQTITASSTDWQRVSQTYTTKESGNSLAYIVYANAISAGQYFYVDDLSLTSPN